MESQSPPNRVNGSHLMTDASVSWWSRPCRNPLLIGSTVLTVETHHKTLYEYESRNPLLIGSTVLTLN